jgi:hypothetical protein
MYTMQKVLIHDSDTGEMLLEGQLTNDHITSFLMLPSVEVYLDGYKPAVEPIPDYKRQDVNWYFDTELGLWIREYIGPLCSTYRVLCGDDVPLPVEMVLSQERMRDESLRIP